MTSRGIFVALMVLVLGACSTTGVETWRHETQITLLVPEAVHATEPIAERVTCLHASGRAFVFEDAVANRVGDRIVIDGGPGTPQLASFSLVELRAVQLYRTWTEKRGK